MIRAPRLELHVESSVVEVVAHGARSRHDARALHLLDYFSTPHTLAEAMQALYQPSDGAAQWIQVSSAVLALFRVGALVPHDSNGTVPSQTRGHGAAALHVRMLNDVRRTRTYLEAIAATVRPGDVVVDVGTGTGILAMAAARAGARHVYAIEATSIADTAQAMFETNGFADRITLVRGWSAIVTLPERADVMVAELIGVDPFDEQIWPLTNDASRRLLTAHARLVPHGLRVFGVPVCIPGGHLGRVTFAPASTTNWAQLYGFDFSPLLGSGSPDPVNLDLTSPAARALPAVAAPIEIVQIDLSAPSAGMISCRAAATATATGIVNGLVLYFDVLLAPGHTLTTDPDVADETNHWGNRVVLFPTPVEVTAGDTVIIHVERRHGRFSAWCEPSE